MNLYLKENAPQLVLLTFLAIVFLQSAIDKLIDRKGNLDWLKGHFSNSPLKNSVPLLFGVITLFELAAGLLSLVGIVHLALHNNTLFGFYASVIGAVTLLMLLLGQRIAKDYEGAKTIVVYLIATTFLLFLLQ